jgi:hypothetical protein
MEEISCYLFLIGCSKNTFAKNEGRPPPEERPPSTYEKT